MIHIENLWKKFGRFDALRGLSFDVPRERVRADRRKRGQEDDYDQSANEHPRTDTRKREVAWRRFAEAFGMQRFTGKLGDATAPSFFKSRKPLRTARSRRHGLSFPDRGQQTFRASGRRKP